MSSGTRRSSECPIFSSPKNISERCVPTNKEVMKYYNYVRLQIKQKKDPSFKAIAAVVAQRKSKNSDNYKRKVQLLRDSAHKNLFDISARKCLDFE